MPQVKQYTVYKFEEASEDLQAKILENYYDINVDHDWWDMTYEDAKTIGLKIEEFDIDRGNNIKGEFIKPHEEVAKLIITNHGESCETYKLASNFLEKYSKINDFDDDTLETERDLEETDFKYALLEKYLSILKKEYKYLTSEEAIKETLIANEYDFNEAGEID